MELTGNVSLNLNRAGRIRLAHINLVPVIPQLIITASNSGYSAPHIAEILHYTPSHVYYTIKQEQLRIEKLKNGKS